MSKEQKEDVLEIFGNKWPGVGDLDYVSCWYKKAAEFINSTKIEAAFVSTNSITQGEQVAFLWKPLQELFNIQIQFGWRSFIWDSEASLKAHVHCVIIGFSQSTTRQKKIFIDSSHYKNVNNINGYLLDADNVYISNRNRPICDVPVMSVGNQPIDGGFYLFSDEEKAEFIKEEPQSAEFFRDFYGAKEFINRSPRHILFLKDCSPAVLRSMPKCIQRIEQVREYRLASPRPVTQKLAETPRDFAFTNLPDTDYIVIPEVSSQRRRYIPMGYMSPNVISSIKLRLMPNALKWHFGVLTSNVHMSWMRAICGRLKSDYDYSIQVVYNNFPWPTPSEEQKTRIEKTAQGILDARAKYPDCSLADLYDEVTMPSELRKAHQENDKAVMEAYGFNWRTMTESDCVSALLKMYQQLIK